MISTFTHISLTTKPPQEIDELACLLRASTEQSDYHQYTTNTPAATTHAASSPNGHYIAGLTHDHLYIYYTNTLALAASFPLDTSATPITRSAESPTLHWTPSSLGIILQTSSSVTLYSLANTASRIRIANGSAGLGRIAAVDVFGENVVVIWEFGRVGLFETNRGRVTEVAELKTGIGGLRAAWGIRRVKEKAEGKFLVLSAVEDVDVDEFKCLRYSHATRLQTLCHFSCPMQLRLLRLLPCRQWMLNHWLRAPTAIGSAY